MRLTPGQARAFAVARHGGQRWGTQPYAVHLDAVASGADTRWRVLPRAMRERVDREVLQCVAYLHDVVEDTDADLLELACLGLAPTGLEAIGLLSHAPGQPRAAYLADLAGSGNAYAVLVKLADTDHNSDPRNLDALARTAPDRAAHLAAKYSGQRQVLDSALAELVRG